MSLDPTVFNNWFTALQSLALAGRWRYLVVLAGDEAWSGALCYQCPQLLTEDTLWLGESAPDGCAPLAPADAASHLGTECANLVVNAWQGLHPNALGILAGTVKAGGCLVLQAPPLADWPTYDDPDYQRVAVEGHPLPVHKSLLAHITGVVAEDALLIEQGKVMLPQLPLAGPAAQVTLIDEDCLSEDQRNVVLAVEKVAHGHRNRPAVVTADRGRGKTAALGIAAARLLQGDIDEVLVTAPLQAAVAPLFERALAILPGAQMHGTRLEWGEKRIQFVAPDELLRQPRPSRLLMVDEAAAIPAPFLSRMLDHYHRLVFTTTVHGYEGTGRGFAVRFQRELSERMPHWKYLVMNAPVRWAAQDPLENSIKRMLFLNAEAAADTEVEALDLGEAKMQLLKRETLAARPGQVNQLVGLLTMAHYKTTPEDIRVLLDGPNVRVLLASAAGKVLGAIMLAQEGGLDDQLAQAIERGDRRPRGHVLPQALMAQGGSAALLPIVGWRVIRIAVHPALQRRGLGMRMLEALETNARKAHITYVGSSYGATADLQAFWSAAGYQTVCLGSRRDAVSGACAALVLKGLNEQTQDLVNESATRFHRQLLVGLTEHWQELEAPVVAALLAGAPPLACDAHDLNDVAAFVDGRRSYEHCLGGIYKAAVNHIAMLPANQPLSQAQQTLIARLLQKQSFAKVAEQQNLPGRGGVIKQLQMALKP